MTNFMPCISEIFDYARKIYEDTGVRVWFRGQSDAQWPLTSTLHRWVKTAFIETESQWDEKRGIEQLRAYSKTLYIKYKAKSWHILQDEEKRNPWAIIFSMRHHGVPVKLLDWTESFIYALYFANTFRDPKKNAAIFVLNPIELNRESIKQPHLISLDEHLHGDAVINLNQYHPSHVPPDQELQSIAVTPVLTNRKMVVQRSTFILCGDSFRPIEEKYSGCIKKFILPTDTFAESERYLQSNGITHFGLFPDLYGLKEELVKELQDMVDLVRRKKILSKKE